MKNNIIAIVAIVGVSLIVLVFLHKQSHHRLDRDNRMSRGDVFDIIDTDDDDKISIKELYAFVNTTHRLLDLNEDGLINKSEMKLIHKLLKNHGLPPTEVSGSPQSLAR